MPFYMHLCKSCNEEFEDFYSITRDPPTLCPLCGVDGQVQRLIPDVVFGKVRLQGQELKQHLKSENKKNKELFKKDEQLRANVVGESKYENILQGQKKLKESQKD